MMMYIEIKNLHMLPGLNERADSNKVNPPHSVMYCALFPSSCTSSKGPTCIC